MKISAFFVLTTEFHGVWRGVSLFFYGFCIIL